VCGQKRKTFFSYNIHYWNGGAVVHSIIRLRTTTTRKHAPGDMVVVVAERLNNW
jgi:hypothetical protein